MSFASVTESQDTSLIDVTAIVATRNRALPLQRALESLGSQTFQPAEIIVVDSSVDFTTRELCETGVANLRSVLRWTEADVSGAAAQRNEGIAFAVHNVIWFFDDDILFEKDCVGRLWNALRSDPRLGAVNAMIANQSYGTPGVVSRTVFTLLHGRRETSFAGKIIGPAVNLLPEDNDKLAEVIFVDWLNTTCTMYRREALPTPPFAPFFTGYSLMEDVALSLEIGKNWKLANARTARIFHDSQSSVEQSNARLLSEMELTNRHHVMTKILQRDGFVNYAKLGIWELFSLASLLLSGPGRRRFGPSLLGKIKVFGNLLRPSPKPYE